jgi:hypothetical protein
MRISELFRWASVSVSARRAHTAREETRWAAAKQIADEIAAEVGVTDTDLTWAARSLVLDVNVRHEGG